MPLLSRSATSRHDTQWWLPRLLVFLITCRFLLLIFAPHYDPSESRYAEISRKMVETGNWLTPQFDYGVPFWAKPPLSMWMSALGIQIFGANEFGSRIFIFLAAMIVLALVAKAARREYGKKSGVAAAAMLMGMPLFFYCSAAVMTDLALVLGTTLSMVAFRQAMLSPSKGWGYGFFIGLAIGLLAKGPLALVLSMPPIVAWIVLTGLWRRAWTNLPWISGCFLMLLIAVPWYLMAEKRTPGFLDYFIVGEHWKRFTVKGWKGDLYGSGHPITPGAIWFFALVTTLPWCVGLFAVPLRQWKNLRSWALDGEGRGAYWLLWALCPLVFFTPARNVILPYPLPALPALALILVDISWRRSNAGTHTGIHPLHPGILGVSAALTGFVVLAVMLMPSASFQGSERNLVKRFARDKQPGDQLTYYGSRKYSAEFYTQGKVLLAKTVDELRSQLDAPGRLFLQTNPKRLSKFPSETQARFTAVETFSDESTLYVEQNATPEGKRLTPPPHVIHL
ncbi:MAG: glycosyltransferase family 39 protein [Luteolibacter sp.]